MEMNDRKNMIGGKSLFGTVQAKLVKTCPKNVNKKKYVFVHLPRANYPS